MGNMVGTVNIAPMSNGGFTCFPVQPMPIPTQTPPGAPRPSKDLSLTQPVPAVLAATPTTPAPEPKAQGAAAHSISRSGTGSSTPGSTRMTGEDPAGDQLSADRKATICRSVYEHMLQRGMTSEEGYLIVDVLHEVKAWITV